MFNLAQNSWASEWQQMSPRASFLGLASVMMDSLYFQGFLRVTSVMKYFRPQEAFFPLISSDEGKNNFQSLGIQSPVFPIQAQQCHLSILVMGWMNGPLHLPPLRAS